jgi:hypothetical protein
MNERVPARREIGSCHRAWPGSQVGVMLHRDVAPPLRIINACRSTWRRALARQLTSSIDRVGPYRDSLQTLSRSLQIPL